MKNKKKQRRERQMDNDTSGERMEKENARVEEVLGNNDEGLAVHKPDGGD